MRRNVVKTDGYIWRPFVTWLFGVVLEKMSKHWNVAHRTVHVSHIYQASISPVVLCLIELAELLSKFFES